MTALQSQMVTGTYLSEAMPKSVVVGDKLASTIRIQPRGQIVLLTQAADGSMGNDLYTVGGIFHTGLDEMDRSLVLMPISSLQDLLNLPHSKIHEVGIKLYDIAGATVVARALAARLGKTLSVRVMPSPAGARPRRLCPV